MKIAITGHRPNKLGNDYDLTSPLIEQIDVLISNILLQHYNSYIGTVTCISGMALGIDTLFAEIALRLDLPLVCAIPCIGQDSMWPQKSKDRYKSILDRASRIVNVTNRPYTYNCMQLRNKWMVDNCDLLISVWDGTPGGTANCIKYAQFKSVPRVNIDPHKLEVIKNIW